MQQRSIESGGWRCDFQRAIGHLAPDAINPDNLEADKLGTRHNDLDLVCTDSPRSTPSSGTIGPLHVVARTDR